MTKKILITGFAASLVFLFSCSSQKLATREDRGQKVVAEQRELIQNNISDPERQAKLMQIVDQIEKEAGKFFNYYQEHNKIVARLNKDYKASRQDFDKVINNFNQQYEVYLRMLVRKREEMRLMTSPDEWTKIMDRETSIIPK